MENFFNVTEGKRFGIIIEYGAFNELTKKSYVGKYNTGQIRYSIQNKTNIWFHSHEYLHGHIMKYLTMLRINLKNCIYYDKPTINNKHIFH